MSAKILTILAIGAFLLVGSLTFADEAKKADKEKKEVKAKYQTRCPVTDGIINKALYYDYKGKRIYVCCNGCITVLEGNIEEFLEKLKKEGIRLEKVKKDSKKKDSLFLRMGSD